MKEIALHHPGLRWKVCVDTSAILERSWAALAGLGRPEAAALAIDDYQNIPYGSGSEQFNLRTPDHIILAGQIGLGTWDARQIEHRRQAWDPIREKWMAT